MSDNPAGPPYDNGEFGPDRARINPPPWAASPGYPGPQVPPAWGQQPAALGRGAGLPHAWTQPGYPGLPQARPGNGLAVASLVLGITSIVFCWWGLFSLAQIVLAIVFGAIGVRRANLGADGRNMAIAGLTCGCVGGVFYLVIGIFTMGVGLII